jgi:threonine/homoserine/homoserine lactone efflux protein
MDIGFFVRGLIIGFSVAAVVGPMCVLCIQRTLDKGQLYGLVSGLGIATADAVYSCIAGFGLTVIAAFLVSQQRWIHLIGGLFLIYLGIRTFLTRPAARAAVAKANTFFGAYVSTFLLTLTNPLTILSFAAIFAGIGVGGASQSEVSATLVVSGVFVGSTLWWCLLTGSVSILRAKFHHRALRWVNRIAGVSITVFGVLALLSLRV